MDSQEEDLSDLLEYSFQLNFKKLSKILKGKSETIKELQNDIQELRTSIAEVKHKKTHQKVYLRNSKNNVNKSMFVLIFIIVNCSKAK